MLCRAFLLALSSATLLVTSQAQTEQSSVLTILGSSNGLIYDGHYTDAATGVYYQHLDFDPTDSAADQTKHRGLLKFDGTPDSFLDLSASSGANSYGGLTLPRFGGAGSRTGTEQGVTFEMVVKFNQDRQWSKVFDFSTQNGVDEVTLTLDGDNDGLPRAMVEQYLNRSLGVHNNYDKATFEVFRPQMNKWYHIAIVMKPAANALVAGPEFGSGYWFLYVNGQKLAISSALYEGAAFTPFQSANYPLDLVRPQQFLAKSPWSADPLMAQTVDCFRVYSYALSDTVISNLADYYGVRDASSPIKTPADNPVMPASPEASKHRTSAIGFDPVYTVDFGVDPTSYVGGSLNYEWMAFDPRDTPEEQANHRGVARFNGAANSYVDLMAPTGPQSAGKVMPTLFGRSSGTGDDEGWTIDMVIKPMSLQTWSKIFSMGTGPNLDALYIGYLGGDNLWEAGNYQNLRDDLKPFNPGHATFFRAPTLRKWQHIAMVMQPVQKGTFPKTDYNAVWKLYVNGQFVTQATTNVNYPVPIVRRNSYIAASNWPADQPYNMTMDVFRVWDRALNANQVESLSLAYGVTAIDGGDFAWDQAMTASGNPRPVYNLDFQQNPTQAGEAPTGWIWAEQDPTDPTLVAGSHTGLAILNGSVDSFMDLNAVSGPNRVYENLVLPNIGGPSNPPSNLQPGWTFELVFKATGWAPWAKLFSLSDARDMDEILLGFDGDDGNLLFQNLLNQTSTDWEDAKVEIAHPTQLNKWYHLVIIMRPVDAAQYSSNWQIYINGQLQAWATNLVPDMTLTAIQGASYTRSRTRTASFLGKSNWPDALARVVYDAFHIYDYAITSQMVRSFANAYGCLEVVPVPTPADNRPIPSSPETTNYVTAGIPTAPVFNGVFSANPASFVGGRTDYQWIEYDPADSDEQRRFHTGLLRFNGSAGAFVNLAVATGPKSVGQVMPTIGTSAQLTFELVVKLNARTDWAKIIQLANGPGLDSTVIGWNGGNIEVHNLNTVKRGLNNNGVVTFLQPPVLAQWYHIAFVMERVNTDRYDANWKVYVNGDLAVEHRSDAANNPATFPMPVYRQYSYIGKSVWNDPTANMLVDMFRVHTSALSIEQVRGSASAYGLYGSGPVNPPTNENLPQPETDESRAVMAIVGDAPVFNAYFGTNPTQAVGVTELEWQWIAEDSDPAHKGIARIGQRPEGQVPKFIDVTTNRGPNSCGQVLPVIGGPSSKTGAEAGWTFEAVFKITSRVGWAKLFDFSAGSENDNIVFGIDGNDLETMAFEVWNNGAQENWSKGSSEVFLVELNKWYHVTIMVEPVDMLAGSANWYFYVNGHLMAYADAITRGTSFTPLQGAAYPQADPRPQSYLGKSSWAADQSMEIYLDAMRVYNYRLTQDKIARLAALYGCTQQIVIETPVNNKAVNNGNDGEINMWNREGISAPVFNANFAVDPRPFVGGAANYNWLAVDSNDTRHRGIIYLDGSENSFIDLMKSSGPNSVGLVIPTLFGAGSGNGASRGWTVEMVVKMPRHVNSYAKLINFANGGTSYFDSWAISWNGNNKLAVENTNNLNFRVVPNRNNNKQDFLTNPDFNKWMHIVSVMQPAEPVNQYLATWTTYVNGFVVAAWNATQASMPTAVVRDNSYIGASQYGRQDGLQPMWVDAVRIYDTALNSNQIGHLAREYGSDVPVSSSSSSKLSGGAIAGIVIGTIAGLVILALIIFCLCCAGAGRVMKKSTDHSHDHDMGNTGYGEVEVSHVNDDAEVEMQETETA